MILKHRSVEGIEIVALVGRLVMAEVPQVRQELLATVEQGDGRLTLDRAEVGFMDSSGLSMLGSTLKATRLKNGDIVLLHPSPVVCALIELTRPQQIFWFSMMRRRRWPGGAERAAWNRFQVQFP